MKIVFSNYDTLNNPFYSGGGAIILDEITKRLAKKHEVLVICGAHPQSVSKKMNNVRYKYIGPKYGGPLFGQLIFSLLLPFYALTEQYDVWIESFVPPHSTNMLPLFTKKPVIGLTSILDAKSFSQKYHLPFYIIENIGLKQYKYIIALNEKIKQRIQNMDTQVNTVVIPPGIQDSFLTLKSSDQKYALYLGRIDIQQKGIDLLLRAWKQVLAKDPTLTLVLAGSGTKHEEALLMTLLKENGLTDKVILKGNTRGAQKNKLISECSFAIFPSRFETFGISALELLAVGKPIICYDIDGFSWIPKQIACKVPKENIQKLAEQILVLAKDKQKQQQQGKAGKEFAKKFSWDSIANDYELYIQKIIKITK